MSHRVDGAHASSEPLTAPQVGMWLDGAGDPSSAKYNIGNYVRLVGDLDVESLYRAISQTDAESDCAQLRFEQRDGIPFQYLADKAAPADFAVIDLRHATDPAASARLEMEAFRRRPFDKVAGPLCGHRLLRLGDDEHWWFRSYSHLITDGLSSHVLAERSAQIYNALTLGEAPPAPWFGRYADFIADEKAYPGSAAHERDVAYWRERLANDAPISRFKPGDGTANTEVAEFLAVLDADRIAGLQALAERTKASLAAVAMALYYLLLGRMAGTLRPTALTPFGNRLGRRERATPGAFAFALPFTVDLAGKHTIGDLARDIFSQLRRDMRHMRLAPARMRAAALGRSSLSDVDGAGANIIGVVPPLSFGGLSASVVNFYTGLTSDISLIFVGEELADGGTGAYLHWRYNNVLYTRTEVARIAARFEHLLDSVLANPDGPLAELTLAPEAEVATIRRWEAGPAIPAEMRAPLLPVRIAGIMRRFPEHVAVIANDGTQTSYGQLERLTAGIGAKLLESGVKRGDFVGLGCLPSPAQIAGLLAIWQRGAAAVMLDPHLPLARRREMAEHVGARLVLCDGATRWPEVEGGSLATIDLADPVAASATADAPAEQSESDVAIVFHTSGSTGQPKPVAIPHGALATKIGSISNQFNCGSAETGDGEVVILSPAIGFDPWIQQAMLALTRGGSLWTLRHETLLDGTAFWRGMRQYAVTHLNSAPSVIESLIDAIPPASAFALRRVVLGGEVLQPALAGRLRGLLGDTEIWNCYGPAETTVDITGFRLPRQTAGQRIPIGKVLPGGLVRVIGPDGRRAPIGIPGELYIGGVGVSLGYIGMPGATAAKFLPDPAGEADGRFYRSGDLVSWMADGTLAYHSRYDTQVKVRGQRIELEEIEAELRRLPGVHQATAIFRAGQHGGQIQAFVTVAAETADSVDAASLRVALARHLPDAAIPAEIAILDSLPLLPSGKIDRVALAGRAATPAEHRAERPTAPPTAPHTGRAGLSAQQHRLQQAVGRIWRELIGVEEIEPQANLFEIGAHSLLVPRAQYQLEEIAGRAISAVEIFQYPTIVDFARHLAGAPETPSRQEATSDDVRGSGAIAIVGMGLRLPGADNREALWSLLEEGRDCSRTLDAARLRRLGVDPATLDDPDFVPRHGVLEDIDTFDPAPFGLIPADATTTDPQHRLLLECALTALEDASCDPTRDGPVGTYVGVGFPTYMVDALNASTGKRSDVARYHLALGNDKDHAATRLAYSLNLTGPAMATSTACSTGLVNVALAVQALRAGQCRMALAGGASLGMGLAGGYHFSEGGIGSRSGLCRPYDHRADGVIGGTGAALLALKRLEDALADGDTVHAVILGVGLSNDGASRAGFASPSVDGQAAAIRAALADAGVGSDTIRFVEGHGTGTGLGDPIEVAALNQAYGPRTGQPIWLGSIKSNMGHLDAAAGAASLVKAVLSLQHRALPPTCHFERANPHIPFDQGPFQVNGRLVELLDDGAPLRAGVSSFGIGGTNAHVILEAASPLPEARVSTGTPEALLFSAASAPALDRLLAAAAGRLEHGRETNLADIAFSLQSRRRHSHRAAIVARNTTEAATALRAEQHPGRLRASAPKAPPPVTFLFPGQGAQCPGMARALYETEPSIRERIDGACAAVAALDGPSDLRELLLSERNDPQTVARMARTEVAQPALFVFGYALAERLMACGVHPAALAGHSIGEYAAACLAGVMTFEDGLRLVTLRGRLMGSTEPGAMLALAATEGEVAALLAVQAPGLSLAAVNGPRHCIVAGHMAKIDALEAHLRGSGRPGHRLSVSHAFHSATMEPVLAAFRAEAAAIALHPPSIPLQSNLAGDWLTDADARSPDYWARHLRNTVRFASNVRSLLARLPDTLAVDCGAGHTAGRLAQINGLAPQRTVAGPSPEDDTGMTALLARLWTQGVEPDWSAIAPPAGRRRIPLPTYPFDRQRFWPEARPAIGHPTAANDAPAPTKPRDTLESVISVWQRLFGDPTVGLHEDFFDRGGDSLLAVRCASMLTEELGSSVPTTTLFEGRTAAGMAALIDAQGSPARPLRESSEQPRDRGIL